MRAEWWRDIIGGGGAGGMGIGGGGWLTSYCLGRNKMRPVSIVEVGDTLSCEFEVLLLVLANRDMGCPMY